MSSRGGKMDLEELGEEREESGEGLYFVRFAWGALGRHPFVALGAFTAGLLVLAAVVRILPRTYHVETKLLARRQQTLPTLARPSLGEEAPTAGAFEAIHRHDSLASIAQAAGLLDEIPGKSGPPTEPRGSNVADRQERVIKLLDKRLRVAAEDATLTISVDWSDPDLARRIVESTAQEFLAGRHSGEIAPIEEAISILESRAAVLQANLDAVHTEVLRDRRQMQRASERRPGARAGPTSNVRQLETEIKSRRQAIAEIEELRRRKLADLRSRLAQDRARYGPGFPGLMVLERDIEALSAPSPQIAPLAQEQRALEAEYARVAGRPLDDSPANPERTGGASGREAADDGPDAGEARLKRATLEYQLLLERINSARIELETARAAFKYRYLVLWPAETPLRPDRPNLVRLGIAGTVASLVFAMVAAVAVDLARRRLVDREQVERMLGLEILGEVRAR